MRCQVQLLFFFHLLFKASHFKLPLAIWVLLCSCENTAANATVEQRRFILRRNRAAEQTDKRLGLKRSGCSLKWTAGMEKREKQQKQLFQIKDLTSNNGLNPDKEILIVVSASPPPPLVCRLAKHHRERKKRMKAKLNREKRTNYCKTSWSFPLTWANNSNEKQTTWLESRKTKFSAFRLTQPLVFMLTLQTDLTFPCVKLTHSQN